MKGYTVITSDEKNAGHVVEDEGLYLIVEHGTFRKSRKPLPRAFAHGDDEEQVVRATVPSGLLNDAPDPGDDEAIARYYGLAGSDPDPVTHGYGDVLPDDPADPADDSAVAERAMLREHQQAGEGPLDRGNSIGITGGDRFRDAR